MKSRFIFTCALLATVFIEHVSAAFSPAIPLGYTQFGESRGPLGVKLPSSIPLLDYQRRQPNFTLDDQHYYQGAKVTAIEKIKGEFVIGVSKDISSLLQQNKGTHSWQIRKITPGDTNPLIFHIKAGVESAKQLAEILVGSDPNIQFISPVYQAEGSKNTTLFASNVIAKFFQDVPENKRLEAVKLSGFCDPEQASWNDDTWVLEVCDPLTDIVPAANRLFETGLVEYSEPSFTYETKINVLPEQAKVDGGNSSSLNWEELPWHLELIQAKDAWALVSANQLKTPVVAVLDSGVVTNHPDLIRNRDGRGYDMIPDSIDGINTFGEPLICGNQDFDKHNFNLHGTEVAGILAADSSANDGATGVTGNLARFIPMRVYFKKCDSGNYYESYFYNDQWVIKAIAKAREQKVDVINLSFSSGDYNKALEDAISQAIADGIVVVAATGNLNQNSITYPAAYPGVIAVGASDQEDKRWFKRLCKPFAKEISEIGIDLLWLRATMHNCGSGYGNRLNLVAPGVDLKTTNLYIDYTTGTGTSGSTPIVAGIAALIKAVSPHLSPEQIKEILQRTANKVGPDPYDQYIEQSGWNQWMGFGRVNAKVAVEAAIHRTSPTLAFRTRLDWVSTENHSSEVALAVFGSYPNSKGEKITTLFEDTTNSDEYGNGTIQLTGVPRGDYWICAKPKHYLWRCLYRSLFIGNNNYVDFSENNYLFKGGDFNSTGEDGVVNAVDWERFRAWMSECMKNYNYNPPTGLCAEIDMDRNRVLNSLDSTIVRNNYNRVSDGLENVRGVWKPFTSITSAMNSEQALRSNISSTIGVSIYSNQGSPLVGMDFGVNIMLDLSQVPTGAGSANLIIHYDPGVWAVVDDDADTAGIQVYTYTDVFPYAISLVDAEKGEISLGSYVDSSATEGSKKKGLLATIHFRPIAGISNTKIWATWSPNETVDSNVAEFNTEHDLISDMAQFQTGIDGPERVKPTVSFNFQNGNQIGTNNAIINLAVQDPYNSVLSVQVQAFYDGEWHWIGDDTNPSDGWSVPWDTSRITDQTMDLHAYAFLPGDTYGEAGSGPIALDRTPPVFVSHAFSPETWSPGNQVTVGVTASDNLAGVKGIELFINEAADGSDAGEWIFAGRLENSSGEIYWDTSALDAGAHRVAFAIEDQAGNWNRWSDPDLPVIIYGVRFDFQRPAKFFPSIEGQKGGSTSVIQVKGNYAYLGTGPRLEIVNVGLNPPSLIGLSEILPGNILDLELVGNNIFAALGSGGLASIDISNPSHPRVTQINQGSYSALKATGDYLFTIGSQAESGSKIKSFSISNPAAPVIAGLPFLASYTMVDIAISGNYAYVTAGYDGFRVFQINGPEIIGEVSSVPISGYAGALSIDQQRAYMTSNWDGGVTILSLSNPALPVQIGFFNSPGEEFGITVSNHIAYVADGYKGLSIWNVLQPSKPVLLGVNEYVYPNQVILSGDKAYLAAQRYGLQVVSITDKSNPALISSYTATLGMPLALAGNNRHIYIGGWDGTFRSISTADPLLFKEVGSPLQMGSILSIKLVDDYAVIGTWSDVRIVQLVNGIPDRQLGWYSPGEGYDIGRIDVEGNLLFVPVVKYVNGQWVDGGLRIVDIRNKTSPQELGSVSGLSRPMVVDASVNYSYVTADSGLVIVDIRNPSQPKKLSEFSCYGAFDVAAITNFVYVGCDNTLRVVDVSNPSAPVEINTSVSGFSAFRLRLSSPYLYATNWEDGFRVIDVTEPRRPVQRGYLRSPLAAGDMFITEKFAYFGNYTGGLTAASLSPGFLMNTTGGFGKTVFGDLSIEVPADTFAEPIFLQVRAISAENLPSEYQGFGHSYSIEPYSLKTGEAAIISPGKGFQITISYQDIEISGLMENSLALFYWNGTEWILEPTSTLDKQGNVITASPDHFSLWAVFGRKMQNVYLPLLKSP